MAKQHLPHLLGLAVFLPSKSDLWQSVVIEDGPGVRVFLPSKSDLWQSNSSMYLPRCAVFLPSKSDLWQSMMADRSRSRKFSCPQKVIYGKASNVAVPAVPAFSCPQKVIYGKAEIFNLLIAKEKQWNQAVGDRGGFAKGRRIFVVSKSENLFVCRMPFFRAIIKRKVNLCAPSASWTDGGARPPMALFPFSVLPHTWRTWRTLRETFFHSPSAMARQDAAPPEVARNILTMHCGAS